MVFSGLFGFRSGILDEQNYREKHLVDLFILLQYDRAASLLTDPPCNTSTPLPAPLYFTNLETLTCNFIILFCLNCTNQVTHYVRVSASWLDGYFNERNDFFLVALLESINVLCDIKALLSFQGREN